MEKFTEALRMLDVFASVGAEGFYVTKTDLLEQMTRAWPATSARLRETLPAILRASAARKPCHTADGRTILAGENVIVRPMAEQTAFIQLDDLPDSTRERLESIAFLTLATSPGNYQSWLAVPDLAELSKDQRKEFIRRVKKGNGDKSASGAVRLAGTENFKLKYAPDYPVIAIAQAHPGLTVTSEQLEWLGLVADPESPRAPLPSFRASRHPSPAQWPSYQRCLDGAPGARSHKGHDRSLADFVWCMTAIDWGFAIEETGEKLLEESGRAREKGRDYARMTAQNAYAEVEKNRARQGRGGS